MCYRSNRYFIYLEIVELGEERVDVFEYDGKKTTRAWASSAVAALFSIATNSV